MSDTDTSIDKPSAGPVTETVEADMTAAERLRAFEDAHFGKEAVRINDRIERGSGSPYQAAAPEIRQQYQALEKLIEAEQKRDAAQNALLQADADYAAAEAACDAAPE